MPWPYSVQDHIGVFRVVHTAVTERQVVEAAAAVVGVVITVHTVGVHIQGAIDDGNLVPVRSRGTG